MKLSVSISPLLRMRNEQVREPDLSVVAYVLEQAGIASIQLDAVEPSPELWHELLRMRETVELPLCIRTIPEQEVVQKYLELHPERITLCDFSSSGNSEPLSLGDEKYDYVNIVKSIREHDSECFIKLRCDLSELKRAAKLRCFGIEFDNREWLTLHGNERRVSQDKWRDAALAAWKLGMVIENETLIHAETLSYLRMIPELAGLIIGTDFWSKAILNGVDRTVNGIRNAM